MFRSIFFAISLLLATMLAGKLEAQDRITVYAAASLTDVLQEIAEAYKAQTGHVLTFSFAGSSTLARQIEQGAPADIFAAANEVWMTYLEERNLIAADSQRVFIHNRLAVIAATDSALEPFTIGKNTKFLSLLGRNNWMAVGDPDHVPAGLYAKQALSRLGTWTALENHLARADNTRAALALVERGEAAMGIVYATDAAASDRVKVLAVFPEHLHDPIRYPFAIVAGRDSKTARAALDFLGSAAALEIYDRAGFPVDRP